METIANKETTISIKKLTKQRLASVGKKGDSYDKLVNILLDNYEVGK